MTPKILIVDDEPLNLATIEAFLAGDGYELHFAADGLEACAQAEVVQPDLILLDNMSPALCAEAVKLVDGATALEASGGISLDNAKAYADSGVDFIAIGALTHSAAVLDIGLDLRAE